MKNVIHKADNRGRAEHGWLSSRFSFSFAGYHNPERMHFGVLRVLNDDIIQAGMGFGMHPHDNMEIVTIPLSGALEHRDNMGNGSIIQAGEIQLMSAGTGVMHSEFNPSKTDESTLLQIWLFPKARNIEPRYFQKKFEEQEMENNLRVLVSPEGENESLIINQDAWFNLGKFDQDTKVDYTLRNKGNGMYIFVIEGGIEVAGENLGKRDAAGIWETESVEIAFTHDTQLLLMDIPMR